MAIASRLERWAPSLTRATGSLLVLLGIIHLIATPFYIGFSSRQVRPEHALLVIAGMRLNHLLTGILLIPLGVSTIWAARALEQTWALRMAAMNAVVLFCLPVLLVTTMPLQSLNAPLFRLAILVVVAACLVQTAALAGVWAARRSRSR